MEHIENPSGTYDHKSHIGVVVPARDAVHDQPPCEITVNGIACHADAGELLIDVTNRLGPEIPQVCYHPQLGPIQTCDTCLVEVNGRLERACATRVHQEMQVVTD